jgi:hypothetical protein
MISAIFTKTGAIGLALVGTLALSGCVETTTMASDDGGDAGSLTAQLSGTTLTNDRSTIVLGADGSMSGSVEGAWTERDGQFCRTLTAPARLAGTICQPVRFNDDGTVTFIGGAGGDVTYTIG